MNPTIGYHLAQAYLAGRRHQAQRDMLARAARRAHTQPGIPNQASSCFGPACSPRWAPAPACDPARRASTAMVPRTPPTAPSAQEM